jgi:hypothetical protein
MLDIFTASIVGDGKVANAAVEEAKKKEGKDRADAIVWRGFTKAPSLP